MSTEHVNSSESRKFSFRQILSKKNIVRGLVALSIPAATYFGFRMGNPMNEIKCPDEVSVQEFNQKKYIDPRFGGEVFPCADNPQVRVLPDGTLGAYEKVIPTDSVVIKLKDKRTLFEKVRKSLPFGNKKLLSPIPEEGEGVK